MIVLGITYRELSTVLAALRTAQENRPVFEQMPHFEDDVTPLSDVEIDELCERINTGPEPAATLVRCV